MEERVINILLEIKADIGDLKNGQSELKEDVTTLKEGQQRLDGRMDRLEGRMDVLEDDVSDVKTTVNALADALLETSREVKQMRVKS